MSEQGTSATGELDHVQPWYFDYSPYVIGLAKLRSLNIAIGHQILAHEGPESIPRTPEFDALNTEADGLLDALRIIRESSPDSLQSQ
jgi:hypothetical protein